MLSYINRYDTYGEAQGSHGRLTYMHTMHLFELATTLITVHVGHFHSLRRWTRDASSEVRTSQIRCNMARLSKTWDVEYECQLLCSFSASTKLGITPVWLTNSTVRMFNVV
ncbi:hypothetical protein Tcan_01113, partial [Toxocara canis]